MPDYTQFQQAARVQKEIVRTLVDEFLIYYAAHTNHLDKEFDARLQRFQSEVQKLPSNWYGLAKAQYIAHRIFKAGGLAPTYLRKAALQSRSATELAYLEKQVKFPWRFSFAVAKEAPAPHVYKMEDVFRGEEYDLYSPGMTGILAARSARLWFNLVSFNGVCWETFGPIIGFQSFDEDDIFFFATEWNPRIESEDNLVADAENNPLPYMMLMSGAAFPAIQNKGDEMVHLTSTITADFYSDQLGTKFISSSNKGVCQLALKGWQEFPHFAFAYYHERKKELMLTALTDRGYDELAKALRQAGVDTGDAEVRVRPTMVQTTERILKMRIIMNPYAHLFEKAAAPGAGEQLDKVNAVLQLALPYINNNQQPDIDALAEKAGVDVSEVREVVENAIAHVQQVRKKL